MAAMGRRLIHGLSGAILFLISVALLSVRHREPQQTTWYPLQRSKEGGSDRGQKDLQVHPPEGSRAERSLMLGDIFIAVKTTKRFHQSRMELLLDTWISQTREQVSIWVWTRERVFGGKG